MASDLRALVHALREKADEPSIVKPLKKEKWISAGGVVVASKDDFSKVYIRQPSNGWGPPTFPKGKVDPGESKQEAALREVLEEIGVVASVVPGGYLGQGVGGYSITHYYLMTAIRDTGKTDDETEWVKLVTWEEALKYFKKGAINGMQRLLFAR